MPKWNAQQKKAIETKQKNILVSASAGSGKTTVLIARLMDLVMKDHISIDEICAMTFTEAAANEMKKRLASELQKAYAAAQSLEEKAFFPNQFPNLKPVHILLFLPSAFPLSKSITTSSAYQRNELRISWIMQQ